LSQLRTVAGVYQNGLSLAMDDPDTTLDSVETWIMRPEPDMLGQLSEFLRHGMLFGGVLTPCSFGSQILVFHFPGVIQRMIRGVPNQIPERPGAGHFALRMEGPSCIAIGIAMGIQSLVNQQRVQRREHAEFLRPVQFGSKRMTDDVVPMWFRSRPPPRGPRCSSADTRIRTSSKNAQHARISVSSCSMAASEMDCWSRLENLSQ
jgi:hypothetical protein